MTVITNRNYFIRDSWTLAKFGISFPEFYSNLKMFFFDNKIFSKKWQQIFKNERINKPLMPNFPGRIFFLSRILKASISFIEVINQAFRSRHYKKSKSVMSPWLPDVEAAFSIYNASKICKFCVIPFHKISTFFTDINTSATKCKSRRERLNSGTLYIERCDSLISLVTMRGNAEELPRRRNAVKKVTGRTAATVPLTDGQTPPGDQLSVTDFKAQIQWYGSFCTIKNRCGAVNKFSLIDLDLLAA